MGLIWVIILFNFRTSFQGSYGTSSTCANGQKQKHYKPPTLRRSSRGIVIFVWAFTGFDDFNEFFIEIFFFKTRRESTIKEIQKRLSPNYPIGGVGINASGNWWNNVLRLGGFKEFGCPSCPDGDQLCIRHGQHHWSKTQPPLPSGLLFDATWSTNWKI